MATLNQFVGFETQGLEEAVSTTGSPVADGAAPVRTGGGSLKLDGDTASEDYTFALFDEVSSAGNDHICGFAFRFDSATSASEFEFWRAHASASTHISLRFATNGDLLLVDTGSTTVGTATTPFGVDTWHFIEVYWQNLDSGNAEVFVDGVQVISVTSQDFNSGSALGFVTLSNADTVGEDSAFDDCYWLSGASSAEDRLGEAEVYKYQSSKASVTPDDGGGNLNAGLWSRAGETPLTATTPHAEYTSAGAGAVDSNSTDGDPEGPLNDNRIDGEIKGMKGISNMQRSGGGASDHFILMGNDVDGTTRSADIDPTTSFVTYFFTSEATTIVPEPTEYCRIGFETTGAQDYECQEQWAMLLHVPLGLPTTGAKPHLLKSTVRHQLMR